MASDISHFALAISLSIATIQSIFALWGAHRRDYAVIDFSEQAVLGQLIFVTLAFGCMVYAALDRNVAPAIVIAHAHAAHSLIAQVSVLWRSDEGTTHLCILILALYGAVIVASGNRLPDTFRARVLAVQGMIGAGLLAFILLKSPSNSHLDSEAGLALHQPLLCAGYSGFAVVFSFGVVALIEGGVNSDWFRWARPWIVSASSLVTIGIILGELNADAVESTTFRVSTNGTFLPWLAGVALYVSLITKDRLMLLGLAAFPLSLIAVFPVYFSGLLNVHSIAGMFTLAMLIVAIGFELALPMYRMRLSKMCMQKSRLNARWWQTTVKDNLPVRHIMALAAIMVLLLGGLDLSVRNLIDLNPTNYRLAFVLIMFSMLFFLFMHLTIRPSSYYFVQTLRRELTPAVISGIIIVSTLAAGSCFGGFTLALRGFVWDRGSTASDMTQNALTAPISVKAGISA